MKREEKNALSRQRILDAVLREFAQKGYDAASLNTICAENDISKGIIYHYFKDKDALYLACAADCFDAITEFLKKQMIEANGDVAQRLERYFDARLRFFAENPLYLGIFLYTVLNPPAHLAGEIAALRADFDALNVRVLSALLESATLRDGLSPSVVVEDFRMYMDYFNARFRTVLDEAASAESALKEHEERCHRQLGILLYGVMEK